MSSGGRFANRALAQLVALNVPDREPVRGELESIAVHQDDDAIDVRVSFTLSIALATYERIQDERLFEVALETTQSPGINVLWEDQPVDLELGLVPQLARLLRGPAAGPSWATAADDTLDDVIDRLIAALAGNDATLPLMDASSYRWLRVLQEQNLSPGASIRMGVRSIYT